MPEATIPALREAIRGLHGCDSVFVESVPVVELAHFQVAGDDPTRGIQPIWEGAVCVFDLVGHPTAKRAYAWSTETKSGGRRLTAVLHEGKVDSPVAAVRAAIVADFRSGRWKEDR